MEKKHKGLSAWQLTMMALGTVIGGSFFLGSSVAIHAAGPAILISYILGGLLVYFILFALSEMTVANPDSGSFRTFAAQVFGPGAGFVVGWVYWTGMVLAMSSEATAVSILVREWLPNISISLLGSLIIIGVTMLNLLGADKLSKLESSLAAVKLLAIVSFIIIGLLLIIGVMPRISPVGAGALVTEPLMPGGIKSIAGSMLIVIFSYAGFEIIGLAASETDNPRETVPKAITYTVLCLVGFYILSVIVLLPLIPTADLSEDVSPMVAALNRWGIGWAGTIINLVLITAILSTMLAAMFGLGRMMRSLADEGHAPNWLKDKRSVPYRGIIFSGFAMLLGLGLGFLLPRVYLFLISSGGFALLFTYAAILATHIRFRKRNGCPPEGKCQMPGYPYTSWIALTSIIIVILSMPFISGQASGLIAGFIVVALYSLIYIAIRFINSSQKDNISNRRLNNKRYQASLLTEFSKELTKEVKGKDKNKRNRK
ncbi:GABA permease [Clostridium polyendosporum]|uniref:GABA permease n=1 Tax=Clostridium polyendosporum TaxID=69208 RepID=A0A919S214_9CLOT|nr:amino acid permease [Clostridium polyendosporum]GIM30004.1 GABA permease [Clostridium polyendosporum]